MPSFDVDGFLDGYQSKTVSVVVCGRADLMGKHAELERKLIEATANAGDVMHDPERGRIRQEIEALQEEMTEAEVTFTFAAVSHKGWQDLLAKHPPTPKQKAEYGVDHNPETFPVAALAAAAIDPPLTNDQAERIRDTFSFGEFERLYRGVLEANSEVIGVPKSIMARLTAGLDRNGESSITAALEESLGESS